jgi:hypothetical protein
MFVIHNPFHIFLLSSDIVDARQQAFTAGHDMMVALMHYVANGCVSDINLPYGIATCVGFIVVMNTIQISDQQSFSPRILFRVEQRGMPHYNPIA